MRESGVRCPECGARVRDADQQLHDLHRRLEDAGALHLADETTIRQLQRVVEVAKAVSKHWVIREANSTTGPWRYPECVHNLDDFNDDEILALLDAVAALRA